MNRKPHVLLVSNRGPVSFVRQDSAFETKRGAGGLAAALDPVARRLGDDAMWIAAATSDTDREALASGATASLRDHLGYSVQLLDIDPTTYALYYDAVSNRMLWFANHCLWDELGIGEFGADELAAWKTAYQPVNSGFANTAAEAAGASPLVLLQDYHLATAPLHLRALRPDATILHFTHTSFSARGLQRLPDEVRRDVVAGMLGADLLGFHISQWAREFMRSCAALGLETDDAEGRVRLGSRHTWVRAYPIPIDAASLRERAQQPTAVHWAEEMAPDGGGRIVVRADRTEPSKNIVRGFQAFGLLLDRRPDLRGRARFVACLYQSRQTLPEYRRYMLTIQDAVRTVNARHPGAVDLFVKDDYDRTLGALRVYDVLLVNSLMDGMNLVSKEGPTVNARDGALVLARGAGSFEELGPFAVEISDPCDLEETAKALEIALEMAPEERRRRAEQLRLAAGRRRPDEWIESQLADLAEVKAGRPPVTPPPEGG